MLLSLLVTLLILGIAFYQVVQGLYSALIMAFLSVVSLAVAFNFYEPLAGLIQKYQPLAICAEPTALVALFVASLTVLRVLSDRYLGRNVVVGMWTNRIGGGILGVIVGMVLVGVLTVAIQMLPYGPSVLTYKPYDDDLKGGQTLAPFYPDDFALGLARVLSRGSLRISPPNLFEKAHDDLKLELFCARNDAGKGGRTDAPANSVTILGAYAPEVYTGSWTETVPNNPALGEVVTKVVVIRAAVDQSARDSDGWWRLPATQFRLETAEGHSYYPVGYLVKLGAGGLKCEGPAKEDDRAKLTGLTVERDSKDAKLSMDWVYRLPENETPTDLVFRRSAQALIRSVERRSPDPYGALDAAPKERRY